MPGRLVERAKERDESAFTEFIDLDGDCCCVIAYRILRDTKRAQDAVQQALIFAWRELPSLRDPERFEFWLHRTTRTSRRTRRGGLGLHRRGAGTVRSSPVPGLLGTIGTLPRTRAARRRGTSTPIEPPSGKRSRHRRVPDPEGTATPSLARCPRTSAVSTFPATRRYHRGRPRRSTGAGYPHGERHRRARTTWPLTRAAEVCRNTPNRERGPRSRGLPHATWPPRARHCAHMSRQAPWWCPWPILHAGGGDPPSGLIGRRWPLFGSLVRRRDVGAA